MSISDKIKNRRLELGMSVDDLALKINKNKATVYRYENGDIGKMPYDILEPLSKALDVSILYLLDNTDEVTNNLSNSDNVNLSKVVEVPVMSSILKCDTIFAEGNVADHIWLDKNLEIDFCIVVVDDSMVDADICTGDTVLFRKNHNIKNGNIYAVVTDACIVLRKLHKTNDSLILSPCNDNYDTIIIRDDEDIHIIGEFAGLICKRHYSI